MKLTGKTKTQIDGERVLQELKQEEQNLLKYLSDTDWYVNRFAETAVEIPDDIKVKRSEARERISAIRSV